MTPKEEYIHFKSSIEDLNNAWRILKEIKRSDENPLIGPAFQLALIEYSKPYKGSYVSENERNKLDEKYVPDEHLQLHNRIVDARDQIHAHSDLTVREAKLYVEETKQGKIATQVQNVIYGTEELSNIGEIIDLIEQTLDRMYEEADRMEQRLPLDS